MKKLIITLLITALIFAAVSCGKEKADEGGGADELREEYDKIAAVIFSADEDKDRSYGSSAYEALTALCEENGFGCLEPFTVSENSEEAFLSAADSAVESGANVLILPGSIFERLAGELQSRYPVYLILLDGVPKAEDGKELDIYENLAAVSFAEQEAGYLAGYAAVADGMTRLAYMGGESNPSTSAYGYGFLQGAESAANDLGLEDGSVSVQFGYMGSFDESDDARSFARNLYKSGTELIFACGGDMTKSIASAAEDEGGKVVASDKDMHEISPSIVSSAVKEIESALGEILGALHDDSFGIYGGKSSEFSAANGGIALANFETEEEGEGAFDRFVGFTEDEYYAQLSKLASGEVSPIRSINTADTGGIASETEIKNELGLVKLSVSVNSEN